MQILYLSSGIAFCNLCSVDHCSSVDFVTDPAQNCETAPKKKQLDSKADVMDVLSSLLQNLEE